MENPAGKSGGQNSKPGEVVLIDGLAEGIYPNVAKGFMLIRNTNLREKSFMKNEWIRALGNMTYGIYVLTSFHKEEINGMIASWVSQVSYDPLLIMVAVHPDRYSHKLITNSGCFALHVLTTDQSDLMGRFKGADLKAKFSSIQWQPGRTGCPLLKDCMAYFECRVTTKYTPGNHTLFLGEVLEARLVAGGDALSTLDYDGVYLGKS